MAPNRSQAQVSSTIQAVILGNGPVAPTSNDDHDLNAKGDLVHHSATVATSTYDVATDDGVGGDDDDELLPARYFNRENSFHLNLVCFDQSMRCKICKEFMNVPVSLPCLHSFCSECVRSYFKRKLNSMKRGDIHCPQCHCKVKTPHSNDYEKAITPNKELEGMLDLYKQIRVPLKSSLVRLNELERERESAKNQIATEKSYQAVEKKRKERAPTAAHASSDDVVSSKRPRRGGGKKIDYTEFNEGGSKMKGDEEGEVITIGETCQKTNASNFAESTSIQESRPPKTKPNYHIMKRKQLLELCRKENLSTTGSDMELKRRHEDWILLYNSECDSAHPRPVHELLKVLRAREAATKAEEIRSIHNGSKRQEALFNRLQKSSVGGSTKPSSGEESFDALVKKNYQDMIRDLKERKQKEKLKTIATKQNDDENDEVADKRKEVENKETSIGKLSSNAAISPSGSVGVDDSTSALTGMEHVYGSTSAEPDAALQSPSNTLKNSVPNSFDISEHLGTKSSIEMMNSDQSMMHRAVSAAAPPSSPHLSPNISLMPSTQTNSHVSTFESTGVTCESVSVAATPNPSSGTQNETAVHSQTHSPQIQNESSMSAVNFSAPDLKSMRAAPHSSTSSRSKGSIIGPWSCSRCTFFNEKRNWSGAKCEVCNNPREMRVIDVE